MHLRRKALRSENDRELIESLIELCTYLHRKKRFKLMFAAVLTGFVYEMAILPSHSRVYIYRLTENQIRFVIVCGLIYLTAVVITHIIADVIADAAKTIRR